MLSFLLDILVTLLVIVLIAQILGYIIEGVSKQRSQFKREVVRLAAKPGGVTPAKLALEQNMSIKQATKVLNALVKEGYLDATVNEKGLITYKLLDTTIELE